MIKFKNLVLQREYKEMVQNHTSIHKGEVGGNSIEIETDDPKSFESYIYNGKTSEVDRDHDFNLLMDYVKRGLN
jgi:hypothetical protein